MKFYALWDYNLFCVQKVMGKAMDNMDKVVILQHKRMVVINSPEHICTKLCYIYIPKQDNSLGFQWYRKSWIGPETLTQSSGRNSRGEKQPKEAVKRAEAIVSEARAQAAHQMKGE